MKIGIDARFLTHPQKGGFKTYTENLVLALAQVDDCNEYILYLDRSPDEHSGIPKQPNFSWKVLNQFPLVGMPWREQVGLSIQTAKDKIDLLHSPCLTAPLMAACPLIITIHDMIWFFHQKYSQATTSSIQWRLMESYNLLVSRHASKRASAIITVSQLSKDNIVEYLGIDPNLIFVTHEAANPLFRPIHDDIRKMSFRTKFGLPSNYILAIGSADPRKNIETLVRAYAMLPQDLRIEYHLVIVWTAPRLANSISKHISFLNATDQVLFLNQVSNEELALLYNEASLFIFPSLYEGFGLPLLEAMACGVPVIAANTSSIPEIAGDAALLCDAKDILGLSKSIAHVLGDKHTRSDMVQKGLRRSALFSWEKCARETLSVYNSVFSLQKHR